MKKGNILFKIFTVFMAIAIITGSFIYYGNSFLATSFASAVDQPLNNSLFSFKPQFNNATLNLPVLRGVVYNPNSPQDLEFYFDTMSKTKLKSQERKRLIKYFLGFLTIPHNQLWVNLSPYEPERIIPKALGQLDIGKDMLLEDYLLKRLCSMLTDPATATGKAFWDKVNKVSTSFYNGKSAIDTMYKVWIVPDKIEIYEYIKDVGEGFPAKILGTRAPSRKTGVFVKTARLKVMMENDMLEASCRVPVENGRGMDKGTVTVPLRNKNELINQKIKRIFKKEILPLIEKQVNEGLDFAPLRQLFYTLIIANYMKDVLSQFPIYQSYIDQEKTNLLSLIDPTAVKQMVFNNYLKTFNTKVSLSRRYYLGGLQIDLERLATPIKKETITDFSKIAQEFQGNKELNKVHLEEVSSLTEKPGEDKEANNEKFISQQKQKLDQALIMLKALTPKSSQESIKQIDRQIREAIINLVPILQPEELLPIIQTIGAGFTAFFAQFDFVFDNFQDIEDDSYSEQEFNPNNFICFNILADALSLLIRITERKQADKEESNNLSSFTFRDMSSFASIVTSIFFSPNYSIRSNSNEEIQRVCLYEKQILSFELTDSGEIIIRLDDPSSILTKPQCDWVYSRIGVSDYQGFVDKIKDTIDSLIFFRKNLVLTVKAEGDIIEADMRRIITIAYTSYGSQKLVASLAKTIKERIIFSNEARQEAVENYLLGLPKEIMERFNLLLQFVDNPSKDIKTLSPEVFRELSFVYFYIQRIMGIWKVYLGTIILDWAKPNGFWEKYNKFQNTQDAAKGISSGVIKDILEDTAVFLVDQLNNTDLDSYQVVKKYLLLLAMQIINQPDRENYFRLFTQDDLVKIYNALLRLNCRNIVLQLLSYMPAKSDLNFYRAVFQPLIKEITLLIKSGQKEEAETLARDVYAASRKIQVLFDLGSQEYKELNDFRRRARSQIISITNNPKEFFGGGFMIMNFAAFIREIEAIKDDPDLLAQKVKEFNQAQESIKPALAMIREMDPELFDYNFRYLEKIKEIIQAILEGRTWEYPEDGQIILGPEDPDQPDSPNLRGFIKKFRDKKLEQQAIATMYKESISLKELKSHNPQAYYAFISTQKELRRNDAKGIAEKIKERLYHKFGEDNKALYDLLKRFIRKAINRSIRLDSFRFFPAQIFKDKKNRLIGYLLEDDRYISWDILIKLKDDRKKDSKYKLYQRVEVLLHAKLEPQILEIIKDSLSSGDSLEKKYAALRLQGISAGISPFYRLKYRQEMKLFARNYNPDYLQQAAHYMTRGLQAIMLYPETYSNVSNRQGSKLRKQIHGLLKSHPGGIDFLYNDQPVSHKPKRTLDNLYPTEGLKFTVKETISLHSHEFLQK